jgi:hypothetical protein
MALSGKSVIRTKIKVEGAKDAERSFKSVSGGMNNFVNVAKGSVGALATFGPAAAAAAAGIAAIGAAAAAAGKALQLMAEGFVTLGQRGGEFAAIAAGYERLANQDTLDRLQELSGWHIRQRDIMVAYTRSMDVGLVSNEQFADALELLTARAQQTGQSATEMLERFSPVLEGRGIEQVTELGVEIGEINDRLHRMGISAESARGRQERLNVALEIARERLGDVDNSASNLSDSWEALNVNVQDYIDNTAEVVSESPALLASFEALREGLNSVGVEAETTGELVAGMVASLIEAWSGGLIQWGELIEEYASTVVSAGEALGFTQEQLSAFQRVQRGATQFLETVRNIQTASRGERAAGERFSVMAAINADVASIYEGEAAAASLVTPGRRGPRGRGGGAERAMQQLEELAGRVQELKQEQAEADEESLNAVLDGLERELDMTEEIQAARLQGMIEVREARLEMEELFRELDEENLERQLEFGRRMKEMTAAVAEKEAEEEEARRERIEGTFGKITSMASSTEKMFSSIISIVGSISGDTEEAAKRQGKLVIAFSGVMAAVELAKSIASFADLDFVGGAGHLAAMAAYIAAAAQAASDLGGGTAKAPAGAGSTFTPAQTDVPQPIQERGSVTIVESYSFGRSSSDIGAAVRDADWAYVSSGEVSARGLSAEFGV